MFVIGGGFSAAEEGVFLTKYANHVTILVRGDDFTCAPGAAAAAREHEEITVLTNTEAVAIEGDDLMRALRYRNRVTGEEGCYRAPEGDTFGLFVFAGYEPSTELVQNLVELSERGYVVTDEGQRTQVEGLYAAGDVCVKESSPGGHRHGGWGESRRVDGALCGRHAGEDGACASAPRF